MTETWHMKRALRLAEKGLGWTEGNPMVGAILVRDGERIGEGYHTRFGAPHAEVEALKVAQEAGHDVQGATLYVTLEPCTHHGKTPPCVEAVIASGVQRVVIAELDPSSKVHGKGVEALRKAGIDVEVGLLAEEARRLNRFFYTLHEKGRPWVTLKVAMSLDGKIAETRLAPTPLTGKITQRVVHALRHEHQAILVGAGTVLSDDPHLGVREVPGRDPLRVILKGKRELPHDLQIFRDSNVLVLDTLDVPSILKELAKKEISSVLVEGGHEIFDSFLRAGCVDELQVFIAPLVLGSEALSFAELSIPLRLIHSRTLGQDLLAIYQPQDTRSPPKES